MRRLSARYRRQNYPKPPMGVARTYRNALWGWFDNLDAWILDQLNDWPTNEAAHGPQGARAIRADSLPSHYVKQKMGEFQVALEEQFSPQDQLSKDLKVLAARVDKQGQIGFRKAIGLPMSELNVPGATVQGWRDYNVGLITSLAGKQLDEIQDILQDAEAGAWRVEDLRAKLIDRFDVTKSKADLLARDQTLKLNGQLAQERQTRAGISQYIWTTSGDERVREVHADLDGTIQDWLSPPIVSDDGRREHPGGDFQCRCVPFPVLDELE